MWLCWRGTSRWAGSEGASGREFVVGRAAGGGWVAADFAAATSDRSPPTPKRPPPPIWGFKDMAEVQTEVQLILYMLPPTTVSSWNAKSLEGGSYALSKLCGMKFHFLFLIFVVCVTFEWENVIPEKFMLSAELKREWERKLMERVSPAFWLRERTKQWLEIRNSMF